MSNQNIASRFDEIYDATSKSVLAYITAKCVTADISDIFQETYLELYRVLTDRGVDYIKHEKAFVMQIAKHKIARHYSLMERLRMFVSTTSVNDDGGEVDITDLEVDAFLTADFSVNYVLLETAQQFIHAKPEIVQKVFFLMYEADLTIPEIAKTLSISESNVKNKLYRTLKELRNLLSDYN